jgi:hypothetical protein
MPDRVPSRPARSTRRLVSGRVAAAPAKPAHLHSLAKRHGEAEIPLKQVAACDLHEAMTYMRRRHADFDILRVEFVALIEMLPGSPLN